MVFPLALLAFVAVGIEYADSVFTPNTRWLFLALLTLALAWRGRVFGALRTSFGVPLVIYCGWCLATTAWSSVPQLSLFKAAVSIAMIFTFVAGGRYWVQGWTNRAPLFYLAPVAISALAAGFLRRGEAGGGGAGVSIYQGLSGNPNYLGILAAAGLPFALFLVFYTYRHRSSLGFRLISVAMMGALAMLLWWSGSRAAFLCAIAVATFAVMAMRPTKRTMILVALVAVAVGASIAAPQIQEQFYTRFVIKHDPNSDIFTSRRQPWEESLAGAEQGGLWGLGYGVSFGDQDFSGGLTSVGYGREKGNSQLAVVEETGIVGAILYSLLILAILRELALGFQRATNSDSRMEVALVTGIVLGLIVQSGFEAWWTSPGSLESSVFWASVGVGAGLVRREATRHASRAFGSGPIEGIAGATVSSLAVSQGRRRINLWLTQDPVRAARSGAADRHVPRAAN